MRVIAPLALALVTLVTAACGDDGGGNGGDGSTSLTIVYWEDGGDAEPTETWTLTCEPSSGTHPDPEAACARLASVGSSAFEPVPDGTICAEIYGGPQRAEISGTLEGERIEATFERRNGCEIDRWDQLEDVLPAAS